ncbi:MAG: DinB family protein [Armatimonadota bacterium]|nr:DinB family protein [Armatimonadota bacterium]MDR7423291.1 DinB family protein [Armatimonadota bacterium]MDR7456564.1 DinB family protein [Armatimonadota bacterium]MDR7497351.1 DinB family protein [Armatimonadota bacterium]MDR7512571.1 DinB family protein [Armatimonadota bacterium]
MDPVRLYAYLEKARDRLLDWIRPLDPAQYVREFPFGKRTLSATLAHIALSEWFYALRLTRKTPPPRSGWPLDEDRPPPFAELEAVWLAQARRTRAAIAGVEDWSRELEYTVRWDGTPVVITVSPGDIFSQLLIHEAHHRAQAMAMLRQLGVAAEDLDYNVLMYRRRDA